MRTVQIYEAVVARLADNNRKVVEAALQTVEVLVPHQRRVTTAGHSTLMPQVLRALAQSLASNSTDLREQAACVLEVVVAAVESKPMLMQWLAALFSHHSLANNSRVKPLLFDQVSLAIESSLADTRFAQQQQQGGGGFDSKTSLSGAVLRHIVPVAVGSIDDAKTDAADATARLLQCIYDLVGGPALFACAAVKRLSAQQSRKVESLVQV
jgi:hypothetical protein